MRLRLHLGFLVVFIAALISTGASATLLYAGGEDTDFTCTGGTCSVTTTSYTFRPTWARAAYQVRGSTADPATHRFATAPFSASSEIWVHAQYCNIYISQCNQNTSSNAQMLRVLNSIGNAALIVRGTGDTGEVKISSRTASGTFTDLVTCSSALSASLMQIDLYINYGTSGEIRLYSDGQQVCSYTGDVTNGDGATSLNQIEFSSASAYRTSSTTDGVGAWSEVIVAATDTRGMARFSAYTVANGNTTGFSGNNICSSIWRATAFNDANYGYSDTDNVAHECTVNGTVPSGTYNVVALVMSARVRVGTTGPQHFSFLTRVDGADYRSPDLAPLPAFSNIANYIQTTNPATGNPWSVSDFAAAGFNVGEETRP